MAYGFDVSVSFGRFFPDGEFLNYHEQLQHHFQAMSMNGPTEHRFFTDFRSAHVKNMHFGTEFVADEALPRCYTLFKRYESLAQTSSRKWWGKTQPYIGLDGGVKPHPTGAALR